MCGSLWGHRESDMTEQQLSGWKRDCIRIMRACVCVCVCVYVCMYVCVYVSHPTYTLSFQEKSVYLDGWPASLMCMCVCIFVCSLKEPCM